MASGNHNSTGERSGRGCAARRGAKAALALGLGLLAAFSSLARADDAADAAAAGKENAFKMQRFMVSTTRIAGNPWRYASFDGFEVLSRASTRDTNWWIDALRRGLWLEEKVMPGDWLPRSPVPYTVIIDDTDLDAVPTSPIHSQAITFHAPADMLTWGQFQANVWSSRVDAHDGDTFAICANVHAADTSIPAIASMSLIRLAQCAPPLPDWLMAGLLQEDFGMFRESFGLKMTEGGEGTQIRAAVGPGILWLSEGETRSILNKIKKSRLLVPMLPPGPLFGEAPPGRADTRAWESEAALFVRWGLLGPGGKDPETARAFLEFARRARREPVTEKMFRECFGFGFAQLEARLQLFLVGRKGKAPPVLAQPTMVNWDMPARSMDFVETTEATSDQIGRMLGDWLRMAGNSMRGDDDALVAEFLRSAGRVLERAYRNDNGLPPDVDPYAASQPSAGQPSAPSAGGVVAMKPFVVTAAHIHDPRLQAVYGLYEHDIGDDETAREFLQAAVMARVVRPKAYIALAEILRAKAEALPQGSDGKLSPEQSAPILSLLYSAVDRSPTAELCTRIVDLWDECAARPQEQDIARITEDSALFPRDLDLARSSVALCTKAGFPSQARELIDRSVEFATFSFDRDDLEQLRATLGPDASGHADNPAKP